MAANATAVWRVRPSGNNNNGGGYDTGIAGAGTDFSQQDAAQVTQSGGTVSTATVTLTDTGAAFASTLIGNGIRVAGTGITTTYTYITAVPTSTTLTLQTSPGTTGTSVTYSIGGGWADFWTNTTSALNILVPGNIVYVLGSGTPNPASYTFDYTYGGTGFTSVLGTFSGGRVEFDNDPATPGYKVPPDATGGMPCIQCVNEVFTNCDYIALRGLWFVATTRGNFGIFHNGNYGEIFGCVMDLAGVSNFFAATASECSIIGNEIFSSVSVTGGNASAIIALSGLYCSIIGNNIHDTAADTVIDCSTGSGTIVSWNICANNACSKAINAPIVGAYIINNTIDGNSGHGIYSNLTYNVRSFVVMNNIISNNTGVGTYAINIDNGQSAAVNTSVAAMIDYNTFYNNTANYNGINAGSHDTALGTDPYVASATEDYTLA